MLKNLNQTALTLFQNSLKPCTKIFGVGLNYPAKDQDKSKVEPRDPVIFTKPTTSIFLPQENGNKYPMLPNGRQLLHEVELGVMIGTGGKNIPLSETMNHVGGYFLCLDMTEGGVFQQHRSQGFPWDIAKGQDNLLPISDFIPLETIKDPHALLLSLVINDKVVQQDVTGNMFNGIPQLIHYISRHFTLYPGDMILTGTPHGSGPFNLGDKVDAQLIQNNEIIARIQLDVVSGDQ